MRVGINCLRVDPGYRGGTNSFIFGLLAGFARVAAEHEFKVFVTPSNRHIFESCELVPHFRIVEIAESQHRVLRAIHRRLPLRLRKRVPFDASNAVLYSRHADVLAREADVLYVPYVPPPFFPFPDIPTVYSIHDIQQVHYPEFFTPQELVERETAFTKCIDHATVVQASSRYMLRDFCQHFPKLNGENVEVIPEGVDIDLFARRQNGNDVHERYRLPDPFLYMPAQLWHHKNHLTILRALKRLKDRGLVIPLVLTGAEYSASKGIFDFIESNGLEEQVLYLGVVPFEDVIALYQSARFLITAALYESSSIPILEAAAAGTPIIAGRTPPNEELAEHLQMALFMPTDDAELAVVLEGAWADEGASEAQAAANKLGIRRYSWENAARMYIELFERLQHEENAEL